MGFRKWASLNCGSEGLHKLVPGLWLDFCVWGTGVNWERMGKCEVDHFLKSSFLDCHVIV